LLSQNIAGDFADGIKHGCRRQDRGSEGECQDGAHQPQAQPAALGSGTGPKLLPYPIRTAPERYRLQRQSCGMTRR
jgi:hypothetical protein